MKQTLVALVENKPGVLNRVASLFRRRNFNIDSLTVGRTENPDISRMTIVVDADAEKIKIRVYLAFTRVLDVVLRNDGGTVDTLTELLAPYGIVRTGDAFDGMKFQLPLNDDRKIILPAGAPSSAEALRIFFSGPFLMAVNASIADMDAAIALCPVTEGINGVMWLVIPGTGCVFHSTRPF